MTEQPANPSVTGINQQKPTRQRKSPCATLAVHSSFLTIQGEGPFSGDPAYFIRLAGCNLQCPFCDTEYTDMARGGDIKPADLVQQVLAAIKDTACDLVVLTGGEPFRQDITELVVLLREQNIRVQIETNGTLEPRVEFMVNCGPTVGVAIVVSPKAHYVDPWLMRHAIAFKYVLTDGEIDETDGLPLMVLGRVSRPVQRPPQGVPHVYVQPADMQDPDFNARNMRAVVASATKHGYRVQVQSHKILGVE